MKFTFSVLVVALVCSLAYVQKVEAFGMGMAATVSPMSGKAKQTYENDSTGQETEYKYDTEKQSVGFVMDTNLSKDSLFNYRLGLAYETEEFQIGNSKHELKGYSLENDFGFGIVRNDLIRLWLGPELRFAYLEKTWSTSGTANGKKSLVEVGVGPVVGLNLNLGSVITLAAKGGYIFNGTAGTRTYTNSNTSDNTITGSGDYSFVNFALIFRMGEK